MRSISANARYDAVKLLATTIGYLAGNDISDAVMWCVSSARGILNTCQAELTGERVAAFTQVQDNYLAAHALNSDMIRRIITENEPEARITLLQAQELGKSTLVIHNRSTADNYRRHLEEDPERCDILRWEGPSTSHRPFESAGPDLAKVTSKIKGVSMSDAEQQARKRDRDRRRAEAQAVLPAIAAEEEEEE